MAITIITAYSITSNGCALEKEEQAAFHKVSQLAEMSDRFKYNSYMYIFISGMMLGLATLLQTYVQESLNTILHMLLGG